MRRLFPFAVLLVAGCASTPQQAPVQGPRPVPLPVQPSERGSLIGLDQNGLVARLGTPFFQVREGPGLKLQWQNQNCVVDAYLYPPERGSGPATTVHVDTRRPGSGDPLPQESCLATFVRG